jgi:hypothetical protein
MLCSQFHMSRQELIGRTVKLLPCRNWHCDYCQPNRLKQLKAMAASGMPTAHLVLTVNTALGENIVDRYKRLHNAWKILVKRIVREFLKPPEQRWLLTEPDGAHYQEPRSYYYTRNVKAKSVKRLHYMAFPEETQNHEPHLHILIRTKYIPQRWLSQQMAELINSPIVHISKVKGAKEAVSYVTKYVTKAPAQFGKCKRYWCSKFYQLKKRVKFDTPLFTRINSRLVHQSFEDLVREVVTKGQIVLPQSRTELRIVTHADIQYMTDTEPEAVREDRLAAAYIWLGGWRRMCNMGSGMDAETAGGGGASTACANPARMGDG